MFRASLCPSSGDRLYKTTSGVSLDVLAVVVWSQGTSCMHCVNTGMRLHSHSAHSSCFIIVLSSFFFFNMESQSSV